MKPTERDIHLKMIDTFCNTISSGAKAFVGLPPGKIEELVREIAERELKEK